MTSLEITMFHNIGSLAAGLSAWILACIAIVSKKSSFSNRLSVGSFSLCAISLMLELFEVGNRVNSGDFAAIADIIQAVLIASCIMTGVTIILNIAALAKHK